MLNTLKRITKLFSKTNNAPFKIENTKQIEVGKMSFHNGNFIIQGSQEVKIGSYCAFGENINIITENHDYNYPAMQYTFYRHFFEKEHPGVTKYPPNKERTKGGIEIGNDVWIGHNTTILSGVKIGNGAILANGSIVTRDVEPYSIFGGIPAKKIKMRFGDEIIQYLLKIKWWNWSEEKIKRNREFFGLNLSLLKVEEIESIIIH